LKRLRTRNTPAGVRTLPGQYEGQAVAYLNAETLAISSPNAGMPKLAIVEVAFQGALVNVLLDNGPRFSRRPNHNR